VQRCVSLIAGALASAPIYCYQRGSKRRGVEHPIESLLNVKANPEMSGFQYRTYLWTQVLLRGAHHAMIVRNKNKQETALWPLPSAQMTRKRTEGGALYYELNKGGTVQVIPGSEVFYVPDLITNHEGDGMSRIEAHAEAIGANQAAEKHSALWFKNGARQSVILETPERLTDDSLRRLRESWAEQYTGIDSSHKPAILEQGLKMSPLGLKPQDSQLLETRVFNDEQIAMMYGTPPSMIGLTAKSTSWGTGIAEQVLGWQKFTVGPLGNQLEGRAQVAFLNDPALEIRHDYSELLRSDFKTLAEALKSLVQGGLMTPNEGRVPLDLDPMPTTGNDLLVQQQMIPLQLAGTIQSTGGANAAQNTSV